MLEKEAVTGKRGHITVDVEAEVMWPRARGRWSPQKLDEAGRILGHKLGDTGAPRRWMRQEGCLLTWRLHSELALQTP